MTVLCVIGDIVKSRKLPQRDRVQLQLAKGLKEVNTIAGRRLLSPYTLTLGDEFQAVYGHADQLFYDLWSIVYRIHPTRLRFSVAVGALSTRINRRSAVGMDGPAFHEARSGIDELRRRGGSSFQV